MALGRSLLLGVLLALAGALASLGQSQNSPGSAASSSGLTLEVLDSMHPLPGGLASLPPPPVPPGNPQSPDKIELGRMLFFDQRLSNDKSISCATCHDPHKAYSDDRSKAVGINHTELTRRTPSLLNTAYNPLQFWDGRTSSLEDQVLVPMLGRHEMGMPDPQTLVNRLRADPEYRRGFREVFHRDITRRDIQFAIASFERTLVTPRSAFDRYADGDKHALSVQQKRGLILFIGKASCTQCHNGPNFTDNKFHALGLMPGQRSDSDLGHFAVSKRPEDRRAFKTPGLRSASQESHYMHNGAIASLAQVIEFYNRGGGTGPKSKLLFELHLTAAEQLDLLEFLKGLSGVQPADIRVVDGK